MTAGVAAYALRGGVDVKGGAWRWGLGPQWMEMGRGVGKMRECGGVREIAYDSEAGCASN
jgi:hypothetical protein